MKAGCGSPNTRSTIVGMLDPKTNRIQEWTVPTKWSLPYQAKVDKNGDIWTGGMASDRIARINSKTGEMMEYPLPANTNIRNLYVDDSTTPVTRVVREQPRRGHRQAAGDGVVRHGRACPGHPRLACWRAEKVRRGWPEQVRP